MSWKNRAIPINKEAALPTESGESWRNRATPIEEEIGQLESALRGTAQGLSFGFADEVTGALESLASDKTYEQARNESRENYKAAQEANPITYGAGQVVGAVAPALATGGTSVAALAAQGAAQGLGSSEADLLKGDVLGAAKDTAIGASTGAVVGGAGKALSTVAPKVAKGFQNVVEDVATAPLGQAGAKGVVPKAIDTIGQAGKFITNKMDKLGNLGQGVAAVMTGGKSLGIQAAGETMKAIPQIAQKTAQTTAPLLESVIPQMGKFSKVLLEAAQRGTTNLAATNFVLLQTNPEYREMYSKANNINDKGD